MELIRLEGVGFAYPERPPVFTHLDFRLCARQRVALLGPNGAGKSTLFHLAMGLLRPQAGRIWGLGRECSQEKDFREVRRAVGYLFQDADDQLFCPTVLEDVTFGPLNLGLSRRRARELAAACLARVGLEGFENRVTYRLSGGEKRLVSLAAVLAMEPKALLLDEPTTGLDEAHRAQLLRFLRESELGYVVISHDQDFLRQVTTSRLRLHQGRIVAEE